MSRSRIPDGISPIPAYRAWSYDFDDLAGALHPLGRADDGISPWLGAASRWVSASCGRRTPDHSIHEQVPKENCSCGFYSVKSLSALREMFPYGGSNLVLGRVLLAGKVIEFEWGYRAERARIIELLPWRGTENVVERLAACVGAPVGRTVDPLELVPPDRDPSSPRRPLRGWVRAPLADCIASARAA
ncbi:MAG TPA: hypothetical protein VFI59_04270 [Actinomycetota bacterium]|nr:hypothetical protein [Actinomycetota bacterium]